MAILRAWFPWPQVPGLVHAVVDGAADGTYAELDEQGMTTVKGHLAVTDGISG